MNLLYGEIIEMFPDDGILAGKIRVGGAVKRVSLALLIECRVGDWVLVCDGIAISKVDRKATTEINYVSGNPR